MDCKGKVDETPEMCTMYGRQGCPFLCPGEDKCIHNPHWICDDRIDCHLTGADEQDCPQKRSGMNSDMDVEELKRILAKIVQ